MTDRFQCSLASLAGDEPMAGTAATATAYLLVENPGPWGRKALAESRLPEPVRTGLAAAADAAEVRVQLIRRHHRPAPKEGFRVFQVYADPQAPWAETTVLAHPENLLDLDLAALATGRSPGWERHEDPLLLVCTNGRRDACCAEFGRPIATALAEREAEQTWETTHVGGHRFAGAMLVLPHGLSYGRVDAASALEIAEHARRGTLDLTRLRGRSAYPPAVQVAEIGLLTELGETRADAVELVDAAANEVTFSRGDDRYLVTVHTVDGPNARQSCADLAEKPTQRHEVASIELLPR